MIPMEEIKTYNYPVTKSRKLHHQDQSPPSKPNDHGVEEDSTKDEHAQRKLVHREIERQRRQDMAKLYASLRALLPLEFIKGKRSTSDQMQQAVNYIKHMEENIRVLSVKRDMLIKKSMETTNYSNETSTVKNLCPNTVAIISSCNGGIQILINSCLIEEGFPLSKILMAISEGFNVITCNCTKVNRRLIHSIQTEVNDEVSTDNSMLQERLAAIANNY